MSSKMRLIRLFSRAAAACHRAQAFRQAEAFEIQAARVIAGSAARSSFPYCPQRKGYGTFEPFTQETGRSGEELDERDFHRYADVTLGDLLSKLEDLVEGSGVPDADIEYGQGVLTLNLGPKGTFVLNKQSPNRQIWSSSPISGPARYDFIDGNWIYRRDGHRLHDRLAEELESVLGCEIDIEPDPHMAYGQDAT